MKRKLQKTVCFAHNSTSLVVNRSDYKCLFECLLWMFFILFQLITCIRTTSQYEMQKRPLKSEENPASLNLQSFSFLFLWETKYWKVLESLLRGTFFLVCQTCCIGDEKKNTIIRSLKCPFKSPQSLFCSISTEAWKKSIKAYLNEEGSDTMAPLESGDLRGRWGVQPIHSFPVDKTTLLTSSCADTAGQSNE